MPKLVADYLWGKDSGVRYKKGQEISMLELLAEMHEKGGSEPFINDHKTAKCFEKVLERL